MEPEELETDKGITIPENQEEHDKWEPSASEERAMTGGWRPEHEWEGDPDEWVSAREFNFRGELMQRITQLGRKVGQLETDKEKLAKVVQNSDRVTQRMVEQAAKQATAELKAQLREARRAEDDDAVDDIEERLAELREAQVEVKAAAMAPDQPVWQGPNPATMTPQQNAWYSFITTTKWAQDAKVHNALLQYAQQALDGESDMPVGDFMEKVITKGKQLRDGGRRGPAGPDDAGSGRKPPVQKRGKYSARDLNPMQLSIAKEMVIEGACKSTDEYANMLAEDGCL